MNSKGKQKSLSLNNVTGTKLSGEESNHSDEEQIAYCSESSESSESSISTEWDNTCKIVARKSWIITGYHLMPTCARDPELYANKKQKLCLEMNEKLLNHDFLNNFRSTWKENMPLISQNLEIIVDPFKVCVIQNFLNEELIPDIRKEFFELDFNQRNMDLYEFFQSKDLKSLTSEHMKNFYEFLKNDLKNWMSNMTGLDLTYVSATCSIYTNSDYLLVHDDQNDDRMIAFIYYLQCSDEWTEEKGGSLQLFNKDSDGNPQEVVRHIYPCNNQFVFFPVTNESYHQVAEVTSLSDCRLSINGWFHTKTPPVFKTPTHQPSEGLFSSIELKAKEVDIELESWISEDYLEDGAISLIQKQIEDNSEISLESFFKEESFREIQEILQSEDLEWKKVGPPNRYSYEVLKSKNLPHSLERFLDLFQSKAMFSLLQKYTDLDLTTPVASMKLELQKWTPGSYSLLSDHDWQKKNELDLIMYFGCVSKDNVIGARTQYVTMEDEVQKALITLDPEDNNLNIVYRDSARFTKYFSKQSKCQRFFTLICSYSE